MESLAGKTPEELSQALTIRIYEANVIMRALGMDGVYVDLDIVDRERHPEVHFRVGEWGHPPREGG